MSPTTCAPYSILLMQRRSPKQDREGALIGECKTQYGGHPASSIDDRLNFPLAVLIHRHLSPWRAVGGLFEALQVVQTDAVEGMITYGRASKRYSMYYHKWWLV